MRSLFCFMIGFKRTFSGIFLLFSVLLISMILWPGIVGASHPSSILQTVPDSSPDSSKGADLPAKVSPSWWEQVQKEIALSEYHITPRKREPLPDEPVEFQAPNRAHNLRVFFTDRGIRVVPRTQSNVGLNRGPDTESGTGSNPAWTWGLELTGLGRPGSVRPAGLGSLTVSGNRAELEREGIVEWYINDRRGLEHGFTLHQPPAVSDDGSRKGPLLIKMRTNGDLTGRLQEGNEAVHFTSNTGAVLLSYGGLKVTDGDGRTLPSFLTFRDNLLAVTVDDRDARYPILIDPLLTSPSWTAESDQANAEFGNSVATAGDVNGDGYSDVIVGAPSYDNGETDEGRAFVYHGSAAGLAASPSWTAESDQANAEFGNSVATAGDVNGDGYSDVIVGAPSYDNGETDEGRAFVYHGSASGLETTPAWTAESDQVGANFGFSVAIAGDINDDGYSDVVVGASRYDNGETDEGRAFVYHGSASGLETTPAWTAESDQAGANFGNSVTTAGDVNGDGYSDVIVGAWRYSNGESTEGRAFVYHGSASGLETTPAWTAESDQAGAWFGYSVATAGDINGDGYSDVIVGAYHFDNGEFNEGRAFVYYGSVSGLATSPSWTAESNQAGAWLGFSVATAGDVNGDGYSDVIVGAYSFDNGEINEGRAFVYHGSAAGLETTAAWTAESDQASAYFGFSVATAGDVNGDGYSDVIIGSWRYSNGETDEGRAFVYHGSAAGLETTPAWTTESNQAGAWFGFSVATTGDVNGDGYNDAIVGALLYDNGENNEGRAFVYHGSASGLETTPAWTAESDQEDAYFGNSVATAGDVNGDGYSDVIVGAYLFTNGETDEGRAFVYYGSAAGLAASPSWTAESDQAGAEFGNSVATAGDVNGDGYSDVIVGAYYYDNSEINEGRAFVYHGSASGLAASPSWTAESDQADANFGYSVDTAGDVNGDGYSDVIVGAHLYDNGETDEGRAFVHHGSASGLETTPAWTAESDQAGAEFGNSVATAGDVNGDGFSDVIVGARDYDNGENDEGRAFVYHGSVSGLAASSSWTAESDQANAYFGRSVATAGDVNGDGFSDVIVGAYSFDNGETAEGRAVVYYGNGGAGLALNPRQRRYDGTAPVAHLGSSDHNDGFELEVIGRSPFGRGNVALQWEVKPLGSPFNGSGLIESGGWYDTGTTGGEISELVTGLSADTLYHWRLRLLYDAIRYPFMVHSRWLTFPLGGANETDLLTGEDTDGDGIPDSIENSYCTDALDADTDDDGIADGVEDVNLNGFVDTGETDPCDLDSDGDGIQDGTELGITTPVADPDNGGPLLGTDTNIFQPDLDPSTTTDPLDDDSDDDGIKDGDEDTNHNGRVDDGETDPNKNNTTTIFFPIKNKDGETTIIYLE